MALGTPVAGAAAYSASGGTSVAPAYPAGILATDSVILFVGQKPSTANGGTVTTPTGWTLRDELTGAGGYGTTLGGDTGNTNLRVYTWNTPVAGQTGTRSVTLGTNGVSWAFIVRIPTGGGTLSYGSADGQRTTTPTSPMSIALTNGATATNFETGDKAIWAMCVPTDVTTPAQFSAEAVTATGAVFATATEINEPDSATGNDIGGYSAYAHVNSGSSTTAPTVTVTVAGTRTNVRGPVVLLRVREAQAISFNAEPGSLTYTGAAATLSTARATNAEAGAFSYTGEDATLTKTAAPKEINAEAASFAYTGQAATLTPSRALSADAGAFTYAGQAAALSAARALSAEAGAFAYAGQAATLAPARAIDAAAGVFTYAGQAATLGRSYSFNAEAGAFSYAGQAATLTRAYSFSADAGAFSYAGQAAALSTARALAAEAGAFTYTGQPAELTYAATAKTLNAESGAFSYAGQSATLAAARSFNAESGAFSYAGQAAALIAGRATDAAAGSFTYTGQAAALTVARAVTAAAGSFAYAGADAGLALGANFAAEAGAFAVAGQDAALSLGTGFAPGTFSLAGQDAQLLLSARMLNAEAAAFGTADPYVELGYVEPDYATNLTATLGYGRAFNAAAGSLIYVGASATLTKGFLFPPESDVKLGVVYGPGGIYTGTYVAAGRQLLYVFDD